MLCDATDEPSHWAVALWVISLSDRRCSVDSSETILVAQSAVFVEMSKGFSECPSLEKIKNNKIWETMYLKLSKHLIIMKFKMGKFEKHGH